MSGYCRSNTVHTARYEWITNSEFLIQNKINNLIYYLYREKCMILELYAEGNITLDLTRYYLDYGFRR